MDFIFISLIISFFIPLVLFSISSIIYYIYDVLTNSHKSLVKKRVLLNSLSDLREKMFFQGEKEKILNFIQVLFLITAICLSFVIVDLFFDNLINFNLVLIMFLVMIPLILMGSSYKSEQVQSSLRGFYSIIFEYYIPILISIISLLIILLHYGVEQLNIIDITIFQNSSTLRIWEINLPAIFLIINPFAAFAFFFGIIGIFRTIKSDVYAGNKLNQMIFSKMLRNLIHFSLIVLFIFLFIGNILFFNQSAIINLFSLSIGTIIIVIMISLIDSDRPALFIERKVFKYFNIPMISSLLALLLSFFILFFDISFINIF